jgi:hypothetical protein
MNTRIAKRIAAGCLALGVAGSLVGAGTVHTGAASTQLLACTASGKTDIAPAAAPATGFDWTISGSGSCLDVALGGSNPRTVTFTGSGTSDNLGLCSTSLLMNLNLAPGHQQLPGRRAVPHQRRQQRPGRHDQPHLPQLPTQRDGQRDLPLGSVLQLIRGIRGCACGTSP